MDVIYIMIVVSLIIALLFFILFLRTVKTGQYDDVYTPSVRMLFDDEIVIENKKENQKQL
ncbi:MAG: cbb3-type cytochrome oxidase assembly protein CcoS [Flavobacteriales bacterium CG_4_9_14_0_2_um_filter_35_242]|nr:cbb3-type cytochrome oxidase assembly protein CcoS [Zetaproteobacteria bacterium]NDK18754.1 cbb3-type cytochrome oxidase assembly protein CcoS [Flavobacteriales bacterium]OIO11296.1 MAG: cytochrome oxidase maturation protein, cbb3-type [Flavobacteriaceae bacterium CG1_02_35_72]PIR13999.1 MAG: cbb3-type cytochrome oxidase assembly protein CcoS [Flavobacteriales bacterium CG11_big_fil_rev_8_21_14_0_20_35_7]PIV19467.1 MAG: cbb3-type cytochrome oxidase assembly protein CcoS [Flavobacteriales bac